MRSLEVVKFAVLIALFFGYSPSLFSQFTMTSYQGEYYAAFLESTTAVVLTGDDETDAKIVKAIEDRWKITPYEFIDQEQLTSYENRNDYSILGSQTIQASFHTTLLGLYMPGDINKTRGRNYIAVVPVTCINPKYQSERDECYYEKYVYKIDIMVSQILQTIEWMKALAYKPKLAHVPGGSAYSNQHNEKAKQEIQLKKIKPLVISENFFYYDYFTKQDFKNTYEFELKIMKQEEYEEVIQSKNKEYLIGLQAQVPNNTFSIYDPETDVTIFYDFDLGMGKKGMEFSKKQVQRINDHLRSLLK